MYDLPNGSLCQHRGIEQEPVATTLVASASQESGGKSCAGFPPGPLSQLLPLRMSDWLPVLAHFAGQATGSWLEFGQRCHCTCSHEVEQGLLNLVKSQLDRCGPEHLHGPPALPAGWSSSLLLAVAVLAWVGGVCAGFKLRDFIDASARAAAEAACGRGTPARTETASEVRPTG